MRGYFSSDQKDQNKNLIYSSEQENDNSKLINGWSSPNSFLAQSFTQNQINFKKQQVSCTTARSIDVVYKKSSFVNTSSTEGGKQVLPLRITTAQ